LPRCGRVLGPDRIESHQAWIDAANITDGPLFRAVLKGNRVGGALCAGDVARIFKLMARRAGLSADDTARISGLRRLGATIEGRLLTRGGNPAAGTSVPAVL
jgi:hypothetical protein